jgi:hypothetical protein
MRSLWAIGVFLFLEGSVIPHVSGASKVLDHLDSAQVSYKAKTMPTDENLNKGDNRIIACKIITQCEKTATQGKNHFNFKTWSHGNHDSA